MRNNPTTITTETIAESISNTDRLKTEGDSYVTVAEVKEQLDRIAQLRGIAKDHVRSGEAHTLIIEWEDRRDRGVWEAEALKRGQLINL